MNEGQTPHQSGAVMEQRWWHGMSLCWDRGANADYSDGKYFFWQFPPSIRWPKIELRTQPRRPHRQELDGSPAAAQNPRLLFLRLCLLVYLYPRPNIMTPEQHTSLKSMVQSGQVMLIYPICGSSEVPKIESQQKIVKEKSSGYSHRRESAPTWGP